MENLSAHERAGTWLHAIAKGVGNHRNRERRLAEVTSITRIIASERVNVRA